MAPSRSSVGVTPASTGRPNANLRSQSLSLALGRRPAPTRPAWPASGGAAARVKAVTADISPVTADLRAEQSRAALRRGCVLQALGQVPGARPLPLLTCRRPPAD